jgi:hypothetical protein
MGHSLAGEILIVDEDGESEDLCGIFAEPLVYSCRGGSKVVDNGVLVADRIEPAVISKASKSG